MTTHTMTTAPRWFRVSARIRGVATQVGLLAIAIAVVGGLALPADLFPRALLTPLVMIGFVGIGMGTMLALLPVAPRIAARPVVAPVAGRWPALNSPASKVPSHGTHGHGQTFAIDLVHEPRPGDRPAFGDGPGWRPPQDFPAFGQPVYAPADGRVVAVRAGARDHRSRSSRPALAWLMLEGVVRELFGSRHLLGNHVTLDLGDGAYATLAHLRQGSVTVRPGQQVRRGEVVAACGNSGNSSEPHVHFQLVDHRWPLVAAGLPFTFAPVAIDGQQRSAGVPANGEALT